MGLTIKEILNMKEMKQSRIIAGANGIDRIVNSTTVLDAPDGIKWLKGMELAFTTTYPLLNSQERLDVLIKELAIRNVSGLGLKLNRYMTDLPTAMIEAANEYAFPIISLPDEKAWVDLMNPIMSEILKLRTRRLIRSEEINKNFTNVLLANSSLDQIAELLNYYIENPVAIINLSENYRVTFPKKIDLHVDEAVNMIKSSKIENKETLDYDSKITRIWINQKSYIIVPFQNDLKLEGFILIEEEHRKIDVEDIDCLLHAKNASSLKILQVNAEQEFLKRYRNDFVLRLLYEKQDEKDILKIRRQAWELGLELKEKYIITALNFPNKDPGNMYQIMDDIHYSSRMRENAMVGFDKENHLVILFPAEEKSQNDIVKNDISYIVQDLKDKHSGLRWASGISRVHDILSLPAGYHQAIKSLYHGIEIAGYGHIQFYDDLGIYRLFSHPALQEEMNHFVKELLEPLMEYDKTHQSDLVETLRVFLENGANYRKTAQAMYLHHNTVRYRVQVISQLSSYDVHQNNVQLQYQVAYLLLPLIRKSRIE